MKSFCFLLVTLLISFSSLAQLKTDKGLNILPEAGDWAIGVYSDNEYTITAKKVKDLNTHKRYRLRLGLHSTSDVYKVQDDIQAASSTNATVMIDDKVIQTTTDIMLLYGIEKRRGIGRVQGFYGGEGGIGLTSAVTKHEFANDLSFENAAPTTNIPGQEGVFPRTTEIKDGTGFQFEANAFIGAEYFFLDKLSIGMEWAWGINLLTKGEGEISTEEYDTVKNEKVITSSKTGKSTDFTLGSDDVLTRIRLLFYFN